MCRFSYLFPDWSLAVWLFSPSTPHGAGFWESLLNDLFLLALLASTIQQGLGLPTDSLTLLHWQMGSMSWPLFFNLGGLVAAFTNSSCQLLSRVLCDPMNCVAPPGSSVHGILQARILEWVAISLCRGSSQPRDRILASCIVGGFFTIWAAREVQ